MVNSRSFETDFNRATVRRRIRSSPGFRFIVTIPFLLTRMQFCNPRPLPSSSRERAQFADTLFCILHCSIPYSFPPTRNCSLPFSLFLFLLLPYYLPCRLGHHVREPRATRVTDVMPSQRWWAAASCELNANRRPRWLAIIAQMRRLARNFRN